MQSVSNFGKNINFQPKNFHEPDSEGELVSILEKNKNGTIRVVGSRHSWSNAIVSEDVLVS